MARRDEDALSWDGDDDPTLDTGAPTLAAPEPSTRDVVPPEAPASQAPPMPPAPPAADPQPATGSAPPEPEPATESEPESEPETLGTVSLVALGVLGGVYLLFAIGWLIGGLRLQGRYQVLVTDAMYQGALWLATAAPLIWFATTLFATRTSRPWVRWLWLVFGALLLIPWPFLMIGAVGR